MTTGKERCVCLLMKQREGEQRHERSVLNFNLVHYLVPAGIPKRRVKSGLSGIFAWGFEFPFHSLALENFIYGFIYGN